MRSSRIWASVLVLSILALLAAPAGAEVYRVVLNNGQSFETAYQPQEAGWDPGMVLILSDVGNWIGVQKADIQKVDTVSENGAFGVKISKNTFALGISPNDLAEAEAQAAATNAAGGATADARIQMLQTIMQQQQAEAAQRQAQQSYTIKQFVEPGQTQGLPARFIGNATIPTAVPVH